MIIPARGMDMTLFLVIGMVALGTVNVSAS